MLIIEILSEFTERHDRGAKFAHYRALPTLQDSLLIARTECQVEHCTRQPGIHWRLTDYRNWDDDTLELGSTQGALRLGDLCARVLPDATDAMAP